MNTNQTLAESKVQEQKNGFSAGTSTEIGYERGAKMVKNYFDVNQNVESHFIGREMIENLLAQPGAVGINVMYGVDNAGNNRPIFVAVNAKGQQILNITTVNTNGQLVKQKGIVSIGVISPGTGNPPPHENWW